MNIQNILETVGICLLILGGLSGIALFCISIRWPQRPTAALWGLFLIGVGGGLLLIIIPKVFSSLSY
jgi:hypothetical protein